MARRAKNATVDLGLRVKEELRVRLERAAALNMRSINAEITYRLEQTFIEEAVLDGPDMRRIALLMATSFYQGGHMASVSELEKALPPARWVRERGYYLEAVSAVVEALIAGMPNADDRTKTVLIEMMHMRMLYWMKKRSPSPVAEEFNKIMEKWQ